MPFEWRKLLQTSGILQRVMELMSDTHPCRNSVKGDINGDVSPTRAAIELGITRGYSLFEDRLKLLAVPLTEPEDIGAPTYEPPSELPQHYKD